MRPQYRPIPVLTLLFSLLGLAWCGYVAFPTGSPAPCATSGCALFRDARFAGLSLWWVGGAYFFLLAVLCLRGNYSLTRALALAALFCDAVLLVVMALTAPCFDCLVAAACMACCYYSIRNSTSPFDGWFANQGSRPSRLLPFWFGLFLANSLLAVNEQFPLYSISGSGSHEVGVFFSPSCPACREALISIGPAAALYPVEEKPGDADAVIRLAALLAENVPMPEALQRSLEAGARLPALPAHERILLAARLLRNKAALLRQGFRSLPLIQINGMPGYRPAGMKRPGETGEAGRQGALPQKPLPPYAGEQPEHDMLPDFLQTPEDLRRCGGNAAEPCFDSPG